VRKIDNAELKIMAKQTGPIFSTGGTESANKQEITKNEGYGQLSLLAADLSIYFVSCLNDVSRPVKLL